MTTPETLKDAAKIAVLNRAAAPAATEAMAVLAQMYGYFSFEPLPYEAAEERLAA